MNSNIVSPLNVYFYHGYVRLSACKTTMSMRTGSFASISRGQIELFIIAYGQLLLKLFFFLEKASVGTRLYPIRVDALRYKLEISMCMHTYIYIF